MARLVEDGWFQVTLRPIESTNPCMDASAVVSMNVPLAAIADRLEEVNTDLTSFFILK